MYVLREIGLRWLSPLPNVAPQISHGDIPGSYRYIQQSKEIADRHGLEFLVVLLPRMQENAWGPIPHRLTQGGIRFLDLTSIGKEFSREEYMASRVDPHASPAVHRRIGESLADYLLTSQKLFP